MTMLTHGSNYQDLLEHISRTYTAGRAAAVQAVDTQLVRTYWQGGQQSGLHAFAVSALPNKSDAV